ncbi:hypothetical protein PMIN06_012165 [Paraphaeosphaeria minitans]
MKSKPDAHLSALELPLRRCGNACGEFLQELQSCCQRSGNDRQSFRDWAKLRYMGDNIEDFKDSLAAYKSTIIIALTDIQLRNSSVTLERLEGYKNLIETATNDLEARLETIDEKLESLMTRTAISSETAELHRVKDERLSTQRCLQICAQLSELIDEVQPALAYSASKDPDATSEKITNDGIQQCRTSMEQTTARLERHMQEILDQMITKSAGTTKEDAEYLARLREEWSTARQCRDICSKADQHLQENISIIDNHATGDEAVQFLVSNSQKTIHGKNRGYGDYIKQLGGHLSDQSIQKVSGDFLQMSIQRSELKVSSARSDASLNVNHTNEGAANWQPQYGSGRTLKAESLPDVAVNQRSSSRAGSD